MKIVLSVTLIPMAMVTYEPKVNKFDRYSLEQTSKILGVHRNTILRYAKSGKLAFTVRRGTRRKCFTGSEILRFWRATL